MELTRRERWRRVRAFLMEEFEKYSQEAAESQRETSLLKEPTDVRIM